MVAQSFSRGIGKTDRPGVDQASRICGCRNSEAPFGRNRVRLGWIRTLPVPHGSQDGRSQEQSDQAECLQAAENAQENPQERQAGGRTDQRRATKWSARKTTADANTKSITPALTLDWAMSVRQATTYTTGAPNGTVASRPVANPNRMGWLTPATT